MMKPWMTPDDTVEVVEFLDELAVNFRTAAMWGSLRKDLRKVVIEWAMRCENMSRRFQSTTLDESLIVALDRIAEEQKLHRINLIVMALEEYVSNRNRRK